MERKPLSIRQFAELCSLSHTEVKRRMTSLGITGQPQGRGRPTLLSPADQDAIATSVFSPAPAPAPAPTGSLEVYQPAPLDTTGSDASNQRYIQQIQLSSAVEGFGTNRRNLRSALLARAREDGRQLGHEMATVEISEALSTYEQVQRQAGKGLGVVTDGAG